MMKKWTAITLALCLAVLCCACHPSQLKSTDDNAQMRPGHDSVQSTTAPTDPLDPKTNTTGPDDTLPPRPTDPPDPDAVLTEPTEPTYDMPFISSEVEDMIKSAYIASSSAEYQIEELRIEYYGEYERVHIAFVDGPWDYPGWEGSEIVAGVKFIYSSRSRTLKAFKDGQMLTLQEALDAGWLSEDAIHELYELYFLAHWGAYVQY